MPNGKLSYDYNWTCPVCEASYVPASGLPGPLRAAEHEAWRKRHEGGNHKDEH
jgi:CRISPR/Cas system CSM-associated protein Csm3 (group 7 of RAMP superfamily)